ncbi:MAG: hypothetical protein A3C30_04005 [Candidatus Levybacteria bacterium RIFCSPHIGHO2_02_FULL_40_18]|nr:MAG: hypothetical protein A2869_00620 [Candidatus Levybacteria bacterium RIFCSPHIGHO2_01_FULL_40_58]OGH26246.1 MAG: hypothetical protein A3C30_04005 [Candidatus Levybacteria bacterium RIFCSPHIGHO2_02_FULL_40_18]OGH31497.1 MAG: hypothetical protein A3E43_03040 [Candidatus Levybacteria bacterium RIFCSPHIGHO2_12_FULL_40_31]OGH40137.1 MAG: hypothetical protein A2894_04360 [Candidatus Levybacteria bacterium RIFCSPLOWO2_01_FULL_40_64]OGH49091.1 MAG: hypothetical protein A3I54_00790 [Candidatus Lev
MEEGEQKLLKFFSKFRKLDYKKHEVIIRADEIPQGVYYLKKGYVRLYSISEAGQELTLIIFKPNDVFPIRWAITDASPYYFDTLTPIEVMRAPREQFLEFLQQDPEVLYKVLSNILIRLGGLLERMEYLIFGDAHQKVASILVICAERFGITSIRGIIIRVPLTHKDIANLIGLTRETTSIEIKKLEKLRVLKKESGRFLIKNVTKLKQEANWYKFG